MTPEQEAAILRTKQRMAIERATKTTHSQGVPATDGPPDGMFSNPETGQMTSRELLRGNVETGKAKAAGAGYVQGYSLSAADEAAGLAGQVQGGPEMARYRREQARATDEALRESNPVAYGLGQIAGVVTNPLTRLMPHTSSVRGAAGVAGMEGAIEGFNRAEGGFNERATGGLRDGAVSSLFGAGTAALLKGGTKAFRSYYNQSVKRPTVGNLKATKTAAYKAVEDSGEMFSDDEMLGLAVRALDIAEASNFDDSADVQTAAVLRLLDRKSSETMTISRLDKVRQTMWDRYSKSQEPIILDLIGELDGMVETRAATNDLLQAARVANSRFAKAQLLENAFKKADLQTRSTGSGGNILNKYRQAITRIITTPREAKWFSAEELALMENFIRGDNAENVLRRVGKLAPGGNGLMTALNVYAATVDPAMLTITAGASIAKAGADKSAIRGSEAVLDAVSTGIIQPPRSMPAIGAPAAGVGVAGPEYFREEKR